MKRRVLSAVLAAAMGLGSMGPALANGTASTRNILLFGTAAGFFITNLNHKIRAERAQEHEVARRQSAYRDWYYKKYGYYPTQHQFDTWYAKTYGVQPKT